jgi:catechol 2,3-dioxygenase-like lactoylglutathione lyase family enzyme
MVSIERNGTAAPANPPTRRTTMIEPTYTLLYVDQPAASTAFYAELLGMQPVDTSPNFSLFVLSSGLKLGLWSRHTAEPAPTAAGGGSEIGFAVADEEAVRSAFSAWRKRGVKIAQEPTDMDFGFTFVGLDPDGHRLRVFALHDR